MDEQRNAPLQEAAAATEAAVSKGSGKKKLRGWLIAAVAVGILLIGCAGICVAAMNISTVFNGISVLGVDMGKLTEEQAQDAWNENAVTAAQKPRVEILLDGESVKTLSLQELGARIDARQAANTAWNACHSGNFFVDGYYLAYSWFAERDLIPDTIAVNEKTLQATVNSAFAGMDFTVVDGAYELLEDGPAGPGLYLTRPRDGKLMDLTGLREDLQKNLSAGNLGAVECRYRQQTAKLLDVSAIYDALHGTMTNAIYDRSTGGPSQSHIGVDFDVAAVEQQLSQAQDGETFLADARVEFPTVSTEELEKCMFRDVLGTYTTTVSGSGTRIGNVKLSAQYCDGHIYNPGEEFWYNATVGKRTTERGFGEAPAYLRGETVMEVGGGICQTSSTLYYAALLANLKIVLRYAHQFVPGYIDWGCDATVSWGGPDFAFANNTDYPIKIVTGWSNNKLTMTIMGTKTDKTYVKMENYVRSRTDYQVEYQYVPELIGQEDVVVQTPYTGYFVETYRCLYEADGTLISRTYEAKSDYDARDKIIQTGDYALVQQLAAEAQTTE